MVQPTVPNPLAEPHWDAAYAAVDATQLSWYQREPTTSLDLIAKLDVRRGDAIVDVGGGTSRLAGALVERGHRDVTVLDVSGVALDTARGRTGGTSAVTYVHADVLAWKPQRAYAPWHDRATFHFLVDAASVARYTQTLHASLSAEGAVVLATFAPEGPDHCSGLPVARYSADDLLHLLGRAFALVEARTATHLTPGGARQAFTWVAARRAQ